METFNKKHKLPFSKKSLPAKVVLSYILDYAIILALIVGFYILDSVEPFHQHFSLKNYTLQYPYAVHERIPVATLVVICVACPAGIIAFYTLLIDGLFSHQIAVPSSGKRRILSGKYRFKDRLWELNCGLLGLCLAVGAAFTITGTLKNAIGKPRPDLIDRCIPNVELANLLLAPGNFTLADHSICTQTDNGILKDGFRSFPSGHSSTAFAGLYYLSLYLAAKLHVLDSKGEVWKSFIVLIPTLGAALVAGSRIMDARHHPFDVLSGSLLGILVAWASYRQYFPPVTESWRKGRAYPIRSWGKEPLPPDQLERENIGVEPLRKPTLRSEDVESQGPRVSGYGSGRSSSDDLSDTHHDGNVFRQQISASQRRKNMGGRSYTAPTDDLPTDGFTNQPPPRPRPAPTFSSIQNANPFITTPNRSGTVRRTRPVGDGYNSSSSEDHDDEDSDIELRRQDVYGHPYGDGLGALAGEDTGYHPTRLAEARGVAEPVPGLPGGPGQTSMPPIAHV
ncbi:PAP2-domain-containing protein [Aulographum hederae CBS 113979]|uniref:PAP2-domain-containing protein n=1 Tax=Aulographum hederae CBS 113979 TaxID=1176131 RepID=A0A6G1GLL3_9PEZI|nr:PAP2-domain-containing protein [Aulographum hederae CBS 113979]